SNSGALLGKECRGRTKKRKMNVAESYETLMREESDKLLDQEKVVREARDSVEQNGIVFIDEIDKITARSEFRGGGDVSREGVQRDLLPLIEGTTVNTKHGPVKTEHVLFICSGAFHMAKPSDSPGRKVEIDAAYVREKVGELAKNADLSKFVL